MKRIRHLTAAVLCGAAMAMGQNLITNPGFESGGNGWALWKDGSASAVNATVSYPTTGAAQGTTYARVVVPEAATENWHIQFQVPSGWTAVNGAAYELKFWARSLNSTNIHVAVQDGPQNNYAYRTGNSFGLSTDWAEYSLEYTSDVEGSGALRFNVYVGGSADTYDLDGFSLTQQTVGLRGAAAAERGFRIRQGAGSLALSFDGARGDVTAELFDLRGNRLASASGKADGSLTLARPAQSGAYLVRASTRTQAWVRKITIE